MLTNFHFFNPLVKQGLDDICLNSFYPAVDLILENFHFVRVGSEWNSLSPIAVNGLKNIIEDEKNENVLFLSAIPPKSS